MSTPELSTTFGLYSHDEVLAPPPAARGPGHRKGTGPDDRIPESREPGPCGGLSRDQLVCTVLAHASSRCPTMPTPSRSGDFS